MPSQRAQPKLPDLPAEAALSFLKDSKGALTWSSRDLSKCLNINHKEAEQVLAFLQAQGYAQPASGSAGSKDQWMTTPPGETVSGAKPPRYTRERVEQALTDLQARIQQRNADPQSPFRVTSAIAFGDFLLPGRARVQAADVGIAIARREASSRTRGAGRLLSTPHKVGQFPEQTVPPASLAEHRSASEAKAQANFLRQLRAKSALLNLRLLVSWMPRRSHRNLL